LAKVKMTVLELVLDGVHVVRTGLLEESLKLVCRWSCLVHDTVPGGRDVLLIGAVHFLVSLNLLM
jgi:hypothetical protein